MGSGTCPARGSTGTTSSRAPARSPRGARISAAAEGQGSLRATKPVTRLAEPRRQDREGVTVASSSRDAPGKPVQAPPPLGWLQLPSPAQLQVKQSQTQEHASSQHPFIKNNYKKLQVTIFIYNPKTSHQPQTYFTVLQRPGVRGFRGCPSSRYREAVTARGSDTCSDPHQQRTSPFPPTCHGRGNLPPVASHPESLILGHLS